MTLDVSILSIENPYDVSLLAIKMGIFKVHDIVRDTQLGEFNGHLVNHFIYKFKIKCTKYLGSLSRAFSGLRIASEKRNA